MYLRRREISPNVTQESPRDNDAEVPSGGSAPNLAHSLEYPSPDPVRPAPAERSRFFPANVHTSHPARLKITNRCDVSRKPVRPYVIYLSPHQVWCPFQEGFMPEQQSLS